MKLKQKKPHPTNNRVRIGWLKILQLNTQGYFHSNTPLFIQFTQLRLFLLSKSQFLVYGVIALLFLPFISPVYALALGVLFSFLGISLPIIQRFTSKILQITIVLMGFGMNLNEVIVASKEGFVETFFSVLFVMFIGLILGKIFKIEKNIAILVSTGTAICGGSAIAAVAPIINSKNYQNTFALAIVFLLNAVALIVFPNIGYAFNLSQEVFGNWAAIAIHDTSSVVGASSVYGAKALQIATTVKLIRALWIIPLSVSFAFLIKGNQKRKIKPPWFILFFIGGIIIAHFMPELNVTWSHLNWLGNRGLVVALFLIGLGITIKDIKQSGLKSLAFGFTLWVITAITSLMFLNN